MQRSLPSSLTRCSLQTKRGLHEVKEMLCLVFQQSLPLICAAFKRSIVTREQKRKELTLCQTESKEEVTVKGKAPPVLREANGDREMLQNPTSPSLLHGMRIPTQAPSLCAGGLGGLAGDTGSATTGGGSSGGSGSSTPAALPTLPGSPPPLTATWLSGVTRRQT